MTLVPLPTKPDYDNTKWATEDTTNGQNITDNKREPDTVLRDFGWSWPSRPPRNTLNWWQNAIHGWVDYKAKYFNRLSGYFDNMSYDPDNISGLDFVVNAGDIFTGNGNPVSFPQTTLTLAANKTTQIYYNLETDTVCQVPVLNSNLPSLPFANHILNGTVQVTNGSPTVVFNSANDFTRVYVGDEVSFDGRVTYYTVTAVTTSNFTLSTNYGGSTDAALSDAHVRSQYTYYPLYTVVTNGTDVTSVIDKRAATYLKKANSSFVTTGTDSERYVTPASLYSYTGFPNATAAIYGKVRLSSNVDVSNRASTLPHNVLTAGALAMPEIRASRPSSGVLKFGTVTYAVNAELGDRLNSAYADRVLRIDNMDDANAYASTTAPGFVIKASDVEAAAGTEDTKYVTSDQLNDNLPLCMATGIVSMYAGETAPTGYLLCDGASYSAAAKPDLFAATVTQFGYSEQTPAGIASPANGYLSWDATTNRFTMASVANAPKHGQLMRFTAAPASLTGSITLNLDYYVFKFTDTTFGLVLKANWPNYYTTSPTLVDIVSSGNNSGATVSFFVSPYGLGSGAVVAGTPTTFNVPDLRGEFVRGWSSDRTAAQGIPAEQVGRAAGSVESSTVQSHRHARTSTSSNSANEAHPAYAITETVTHSGTTETRPDNIALNYIIKE